MIQFDTIPGSIRTPGVYAEFNTRMALRSLPGNPQKMLIAAPMTAAGSATPLTLYNVDSDVQAALLFGDGSLAHVMARSAVSSNPRLQLQIIAVQDASDTLRASATVQINGMASASGICTLWIASHSVNYAVQQGDTEDMIYAGLVKASGDMRGLPVVLSLLKTDPPVAPMRKKSDLKDQVQPGSGGNTGTVADPDELVPDYTDETYTSALAIWQKDGQSPVGLRITAKNTGDWGNAIRLRYRCSARGVSVRLSAMSNGAGETSLQGCLDAVFAAGHNVIAIPGTSRGALSILSGHLDAVSDATEKRGAVGTAGCAGTLADAVTMADINSGRISVAWHAQSVFLPCEIAAGYAAVIAGEEDPARPLNGLIIAPLDETPATAHPGRKEKERALHSGVTPLEVVRGGKVAIVRSITTRTTDDRGIDDPALLDLTTIRTLDYCRKAWTDRIALRFPREKLTRRTEASVRSELLDVAYKLEEQEIIEAVKENQAKFQVERSATEAGTLNAVIPCDVVNGLHVFAARIDLYL